jgi:hypothetical protein
MATMTRRISRWLDERTGRANVQDDIGLAAVVILLVVLA